MTSQIAVEITNALEDAQKTQHKTCSANHPIYGQCLCVRPAGHPGQHKALIGKPYVEMSGYSWWDGAK